MVRPGGRRKAGSKKGKGEGDRKKRSCCRRGNLGVQAEGGDLAVCKNPPRREKGGKVYAGKKKKSAAQRRVKVSAREKRATCHFSKEQEMTS